VQVEPMKSKLKAPGTKRLKLKYDNLLSSFAFKFNLRLYMEEIVYQRQVGRCRLTVSKPALKAPEVSALEADI